MPCRPGLIRVWRVTNMNNSLALPRQVLLPSVPERSVMLPPNPYPIDAFLVNPRNAINEVWGYVRAPDAVVAMSFLEAMSIAIQGSVDVRLPTGEVRPVSLDLLTIAKSGERKSTVDRLVMKPIFDFDKEQLKQSKLEMNQYRAELAVWEEKLKVLRAKVRAVIKVREARDAD